MKNGHLDSVRMDLEFLVVHLEKIPCTLTGNALFLEKQSAQYSR